MYIVRLMNRTDNFELEATMTPNLRDAIAQRDRLVAEIVAEGYAWYKGAGVTKVYVHPAGAGPELGVEMRGGC